MSKAKMTFHLLETIGEGTFGRVRKFYDESKMIVQAVKFCYVESDDDELEMIDVTNMLRESASWLF